MRNKERVKAAKDRYARANPEKVVAAKRKYLLANPEKVAAAKEKWRLANPKKIAENTRKWRKANPEKIAARKKKIYWQDPAKARSYQRKCCYGVTEEQYQEMLSEQQNRCAICKDRFAKTPHVDHNHVTGKVRGLLCQPCNHAIGNLRDNPDNASSAEKYLRKHS